MTAVLPTLLVMTPVGVPLYAARGLVQTLTPSGEAKPSPRRTINGELVWLGLDAMKKYDTEITCTDQDAPAIDGLFPGDIVVIECVCELAYPDVTGAAPSREVVTGTERTSGEHVYYRPRMTFMITDISMSNDEYAHDYSWKISGKEV